MAKTEVTGFEIEDLSVAAIDLAEDVIPFIRERTAPTDFVVSGEVVLILQNRQHIVTTELVIDGEIILNGTIGIL